MMPKALPVHMTASALKTMRRHAEAEYPLECCGLLVGRRRGELRTVVYRAEPARNVQRERPHDRYEIDPMDYLRVDREAAADGLEVVGFYHSHPDGRAVPSTVDVARAWPVYSYAIVAVEGVRAGDVRCWVFDPDRAAFCEQPVVIIDDPEGEG